jgi:hypothetical protein
MKASCRRGVWLAVIGACLVGVIGAGGEDFKSSLQPGTALSSFHCRDVTGPNKGRSLCYVCDAGPNPVAMLFARDITPPLVNLIKEFDSAVTKNKAADLRSFAVFLCDDTEEMEPTLVKLAEKEKISKSVPLTVVEDIAGLEAYKIHKNAAVTVLLFTKGKVVSNFAYKAGELQEKQVKAIMADLPKILPSEEELKAVREATDRIKKIDQELRRKRDAEAEKKEGK